MKKTFQFMFLIIMIVFYLGVSGNVHAAGNLLIESDAPVVSSTGHYTSGYFYCAYYYNGYWMVSGYRLSNAEYCYILKDENGNMYLRGKGGVLKRATRSHTDVSLAVQNVDKSMESLDYTDKEFNIGPLNSTRDYEGYEQVVNFLIFDSGNVDAVDSYVNDGDTSGADNVRDFAQEYDDEIPLPHNVKVLQGDNQTLGGTSFEKTDRFVRDVVISWEQEDVIDGMSYEIQYRSSAWRMEELDEVNITNHTGAFHTIIQDTYDGVKTVTVNLDCDWLNDYKEKGFLSQQVFRIRNICSNKTSNWVSITIDLDNGSVSADEDGYYSDDDVTNNEYDNTDVGPNPTINTNNISVNGVMSYIKGGFGLLGNGGILSLMAGVFSFLPGSVMDIIKFYLSMIVTFSLVAAFIKIVF